MEGLVNRESVEGMGRGNRGKRTGAGQRIGGIGEHGDAFPFLCACGLLPDPCLLCVGCLLPRSFVASGFCAFAWFFLYVDILVFVRC